MEPLSVIKPPHNEVCVRSKGNWIPPILVVKTKASLPQELVNLVPISITSGSGHLGLPLVPISISEQMLAQGSLCLTSICYTFKAYAGIIGLLTFSPTLNFLQPRSSPPTGFPFSSSPCYFHHVALLSSSLGPHLVFISHCPLHLTASALLLLTLLARPSLLP